MAVDKTSANTRRRNVEPRSSILDMQTLDADVSGLTVAPEDGEWVLFNGALQAATNAVADASTAMASRLCMVWSEAGRSDVQATGRARVPVIFRHSFHCELELYNYDAAALPELGWVLIVEETKEAIQGDTGTTRLVVTPKLGTAGGLGGAGNYWIVGHVMKGVSAAGDAMEIMVYDSPKSMTV